MCRSKPGYAGGSAASINERTLDPGGTAAMPPATGLVVGATGSIGRLAVVQAFRQAVQAAEDLRAQALLPAHMGRFSIAGGTLGEGMALRT